MPMHNWNWVTAAAYHEFHQRWVADLTNHLNGGLLPATYYAHLEKVSDGGSAERASQSDRPEAALFATQARRIAIRRESEDGVVALVEVITPGNKLTAQTVQVVQQRVLQALRSGLHFLLIDLLPPGPYDPDGIHGEVWRELTGEAPVHDGNPLALVSFAVGDQPTAYLETLQPGDSLPSMPLHLDNGSPILLPLEQSYNVTFRGIPRRWRDVLTGTTPP